MPTLETVQLTKKYGNFTALDHLDLKMEGAKCVGFLGPNGAGKTTTLKLLSDMIYPTEGECYINGIPVKSNRKLALADAGVLIETPEIYPSLTPREALTMIADLRGIPSSERKTRIDEVLEEVKMSEWADQRVGKFSKGMKQRINVAASLVHDPDIIILDEPATGLDPRGMAEIRQIVRGLKKRDRLIFMSSHILQEVTDVCDEVALINKGKLIFYDTLANVTARFADGNYSVDVALSREANKDVAREVETIKNVTSCEILDKNRLRITFKGGPKAQQELLESMVKLHLGMLSFADSAGTLEEVYLSEIERGD